MPNISIIELDNTDSTNKYAMHLIDANKAHAGLTIVARSQTSGRGQRGKTWVDEPGKSLLMSVITSPMRSIGQQFTFNASVAVAIANVLQKIHNKWDLAIKWPNDIIINDKKAGGILIENILRGSRWTHCVVGLGLNVTQDTFPGDLPYATSLKIESGLVFDIKSLQSGLADGIMATTLNSGSPADVFKAYNDYLYKRNRKQKFSNADGKWEATITKAHEDGTLEVMREDGNIERYYHGQVLWEWEQ